MSDWRFGVVFNLSCLSSEYNEVESFWQPALRYGIDGKILLSARPRSACVYHEQIVRHILWLQFSMMLRFTPRSQDLGLFASNANIRTN